MSFAKLDSGIVNSTLWVQPHDVLRTWIALLAQADAAGYVRTAAPSLAHLCMVPLDRMRDILTLLESPDPDSRSSTDEGRRIRKVEGGWELVNYSEYRSRRQEEDRRSAQREWDRANRPSGHARSKKSEKVQIESETVRHSPTSPTQAEAEAEVDTEAEQQDQKQFAPPENPATPIAVISLPLNTGEEYPITAEQVREFSDLYPAVDVLQALRAMRGWCVTNPTNRKTRAGILRFVNRWLAKEQDSGNRGSSHANRSSSGQASAVARVEQAIRDRRAAAQSAPAD